MSLQTGADLRTIRERRPLVHQITNYVVMNETANATLALGALPVMAHAPQEVKEMASVAGALVLNLGTLSEAWIHGRLLAGAAANRSGVPVVLDPVGAGATRYRTETARRLLDKLEIAVVRGNAAEIATLAGQEAEIRGVESVGAAAGPELAEAAARALGCVAAVTGPVDHVSDGAGGATVVQLRRKGATTDELVEIGRPFRELPVTFVVNDDVEAAIRLTADGVHLGREDAGAERALEAGLVLGLSAASVDEAQAAG